MDTRLEALAGFVLDGLIGRNLSDAAAYEFAEQVCICIREGTETLWGDQMKKLWDYLAGGSSALDGNTQDVDSAFQQGRVYAAMELLRMFHQRQEDEYTLEEDAKEYSVHWKMVFLALYQGKSLTHRELARAADLSDSSLSQFLHKIEKKNYILFRKAGRTKYYWLSSRGRKLVKCMPSRKRVGFDFEFRIARKPEWEHMEFYSDKILLFYQQLLVQNRMYFKESYPSAYADSTKIKMISEVKEDMYVCMKL